MSEFSSVTAADLASQAIDTLRKSIAEQIAKAHIEGEEHTPWDEEKDGVGWVDNELGFLDQLREEPEYKKARDSEFQDLDTVEQCQKLIVERGLVYARQVLAFIRAGGTAIDNIFQLRARGDKEEITAFLNGLSIGESYVISPN